MLLIPTAYGRNNRVRICMRGQLGRAQQLRFREGTQPDEVVVVGMRDAQPALAAGRQSINCRRTDIDMEPDMEWPVCQVIARDEVMRKYPHLLQFSSTRDEQPRVLWIRKPEQKKTEAVK